MREYNPQFNLRDKKTGKVFDLTDTLEIRWNDENYEKVVRRKTWRNQLSKKLDNF